MIHVVQELWSALNPEGYLMRVAIVLMLQSWLPAHIIFFAELKM